MKYLKTYNLYNESSTEMNEESYKKLIVECLLQLSESYEHRFIYDDNTQYKVYDAKDGDRIVIYYDFYIEQGYNPSELIQSLNNSLDNLINDLGYKVIIHLNKYNTKGDDNKYAWSRRMHEKNLDEIKLILFEDTLAQDEQFELSFTIYPLIKESLNISKDIQLVFSNNANLYKHKKNLVKYTKPTIESVDEIIKSYKEKIDECILYLTDTYNVEYIDPKEDMGNQGELQDCFQYMFLITTDDNIDECIDVLKSSIDRIKYELDGDSEFQIYFIRGNISGTLEQIEFKLREEYEIRTQRVKEIKNMNLKANTHVAEINLIVL